MKRSSATSVQLIAMSARSSSSSYRGRNHFRRGRFSGRRQYSGGRGDEQFVTGDSHFQSVQEANLGIRQSSTPQRPNQPSVRPAPPNHHNQFGQSPTFHKNQQPQQFRPRPPKQLNYREWQHSKTAPESNSGKFIVVSYNILADYLAINHRSKLYFHIPRYMLDWEWRKTSILFELRLWSPDIMCFQEVDKFMDLAEQLKLQGYSGIWKMRTGNAVDGCAIFWRSSRFKLLHEESIQFNKVGLRDNVAQICVLELLSNNSSSNTPPLTASSAGSEKVVICNIHVLYNPKRGEIKIGQVRILLDMAHAVSKIWNAPIVLCGDFNCTPKSPLYNFMSEQKLDLSGVHRDKVSGQASGETRAPGQNNPNYCTKSNFNPNPSSTPVVRNPSSDRSTQAPLIIHNQLDDSLSDVQNQKIPDEKAQNVPSTNDCLHPQVIRSTPAACDISQCCSKDSLRRIGETKETQENVINSRASESAISVLIDSFEENLSVYHSESESRVIHMSAATVTSHGAEIYTASQANISSGSTGLYHAGAEKLGASLEETSDCQLDGGMVREDQSTFLSALHDKEDPFQIDCRQPKQSDLALSHSDYTSNLMDSQTHSPDKEIFDDVSLELDYEAATADNTAYDPSLWTPMEIATATGNADCTVLEHPLKLKSTYTEIEDHLGTRDPYGEPLATSYNRCFLGTVDYIWRSEGLQTTRVLAPIPKHAMMQWTPGFPTKKWGSDHIALACELAFTKDATDNKLEAQ